MLNNEYLFKAKIVQMILMKENVKAIEALSHHYGVGIPNLKVGMPKRYSKTAGCYVSKTKTIHVMNQEYLDNPFVVLHEFYHHLRQGRPCKGWKRWRNLPHRGLAQIPLRLHKRQAGDKQVQVLFLHALQRRRLQNVCSQLLLRGTAKLRSRLYRRIPRTHLKTSTQVLGR